MGLGGPVWHASVACQRMYLPEDELRRLAFKLLEGYGHADLGQWEHFTGAAFHLRRRLAESEAALVGPVVDVRGTEEAARRVGKVSKWLVRAGPAAMDVAVAEVEGR